MYVYVAKSGLLRELSLERTHQRVKRAIQISNNKDVHKFVMDRIRFADWQARLTSVLVHYELIDDIFFHHAGSC